MIIDEDDYLAHYGILRRSGRYPWGSGGTTEKRSKDFLDHIKELRKQGISDTDIARGFGMTTTEFRNLNSIAKNAARAADVAQAQRLRDKGLSNMAIAKAMNKNESTVRSLLAPGVKDKVDVLQTTSNMLRDQVANKKYIDVGTGVEYHVGVSRQKLDTAIAALKDEGYGIHYVQFEQLGTGKKTTMKVLAAPGTTYSEVYRNRHDIKQITDFSEDGGRSFLGIHPPLSIDSKRVAVRYAEDGGAKADGVIFVRPGVEDISLGSSHYAQVRIAVDGTHYLKGMAMYKDDLPPGVDLLFNTNKSNTGNKLDAMKKIKDDPENPFGAIVRQKVEVGPDGKKRVTSVMNIVGSKEGMGEEGGWETWSKNLSSQFLSKQSPTLAKTQLDMTFEQKKNELDSIMQLTNPVVKKVLLEKFADGADSSAVHLKAAHLPRQGTHVILPVNSMKETEIYAPNFRDGEKVVLVRHPHGGVFEIPELTVNNRHPEARKLLGKQAKDAVGINHKVAEKLSGADFDGDTVLVIPNNHGKIKTAPSLLGLKNFDPKHSYPGYEGMKVMTSRQTQTEMGLISNLITDMTIKGASHEELARAVRHSMVVIDAEKHGLNYKQSALDNGIAQLKEKYQGSTRGGASTLISRAGSEIRVPERRPRPAAKGGHIDPKTGQLMWEPTGETITRRSGKVEIKKFKSTKLAETQDAFTLVSDGKGTRIEKVYAEHSNKLKGLANKARLEMLGTKNAPYSPSAKTAYSNEVRSLDAKLKLALRNRPLERQAQLLANATVRLKKQANPDMEPSELKKIKSLALEEARTRTGAHKTKISITQEEWNAIQAGAISSHQLSEILKNADLDQVKKLATPKTALLMTSAKKARARAMLSSGYTQADIADALGVSLTTLKNSM